MKRPREPRSGWDLEHAARTSCRGEACLRQSAGTESRRHADAVRIRDSCAKGRTNQGRRDDHCPRDCARRSLSCAGWRSDRARGQHSVGKEAWSFAGPAIAVTQQSLRSRCARAQRQLTRPRGCRTLRLRDVRIAVFPSAQHFPPRSSLSPCAGADRARRAGGRCTVVLRRDAGQSGAARRPSRSARRNRRDRDRARCAGHPDDQCAHARRRRARTGFRACAGSLQPGADGRRARGPQGGPR